MDGFYGAAFATMPHETLVRFGDSRRFTMFDQPDGFEADLDKVLAQ